MSVCNQSCNLQGKHCRLMSINLFISSIVVPCPVSQRPCLSLSTNITVLPLDTEDRRCSMYRVQISGTNSLQVSTIPRGITLQKARDWSCLPAISCDFSTMSPSPNKRPLVALGADQICYYGQNHQNRYVQGSISNPPLACKANTVYVEMLSVANSSRISDATLKKGGGGPLMPLIVDVGGCVYRTNASTEDVFDVRKRVLLRILFGHAL